MEDVLSYLKVHNLKTKSSIKQQKSKKTKCKPQLCNINSYQVFILCLKKIQKGLF